MQDGRRKTRAAGKFRIHMERISIFIEAIEQGLVGPGADGHRQVSRALWHRVWIGQTASGSAQPPIASCQDHGFGGEHRLARGQAGLRFEHHHRAFLGALVDHLVHARIHQQPALRRDGPMQGNALLAMQDATHIEA